MKLICHIYDQARKSTRAIVVVTYGDNSKKRLRLNRKRGTYEIDLDVKEGEKITFLIGKKRCERIVQAEFARMDDYHFVLGEKGMKYQRVGNVKVPFNTYEGLYAIEGSGDEFEKLLLSLDLELVKKVGDKVLSSNNVYKKNIKKRKRSKKGNVNQYRNDLKVLREHDTVDAAGPISKIKNKSIEILSNEILVKFKPKVSVANINRLVNDCGLKISYLNLDGEYIIEAGQDCEYNLIDLIEELYETGFVERIHPLTRVKSPADVVPTNFLWKGQYTHGILKVKEAWDALELKNGIAQRYGTGDIIIGVTDNGLTPKDNGDGTFTIHPSFAGTVTLKDTTTPPKINQLHDFRAAPKFGPNNNNEVDSDSHGVNVCGIISADPTLAFGTAGLAGNTQLFSFIIQTIDVEKKIDALYWAAGLRAYPGAIPVQNLPQLSRGFDVLASSIAYDYESSVATVGGLPVLTDKFGDFVKEALLRGRKGRGVLMAFSAGKEAKSHQFIAPTLASPEENRFSVYDGVLAIGAVADYTNIGERKTEYSNTGKIDFCAPSSGGYGIGGHDPSRRYETWTPSRIGKGELLGSSVTTYLAQHELHTPYELIEAVATIDLVFDKSIPRPETETGESVSISEADIDVDSATDFEAGMTALLYDSDDDYEFFKIDAVAGNTLSVDSDTPIGKTFSNNTEVRGYAKEPKTKLSVDALVSVSSITVKSATGFKRLMRIFVRNSTTNDQEFVTISSISGNVLTLSSNLVNPNPYLIADDIDVTGLTAISVLSGGTYSVNQKITLEYVAHGRTYFDNVTVWNIVGNKIHVNGVDASHRIEEGSKVVIRERPYYNNIGATAIAMSSPIAANYNPTVPLAVDPADNLLINDISFLDATMDVNDPSLFVEKSVIKVESLGNVEWNYIISISGNTLSLAKMFNHEHLIANAEGTGYPGISFTGADFLLNPADHIKIERSGTDLYAEVLIRVPGTHHYALQPTLPSVSHSAWDKVIRVPGIRLNTTAGLSDTGDDNFLLIGEPNYDVSTKVEDSERVEIEEVVNSKTIILKKLRKGHPRPGGILNVRKGDLDYSDSFGGTSSACPTVAGVIGLVLSANANLTWREIVNILQETSDKIDLNTKGYSGNTTNASGAATDDGEVFSYDISPDGTTRPAREGQWKNKAGGYIFGPDGVTPSGVGDTVPYHSAWYGYGRVNAELAVQAAIDYSQTDRDLVIRNTLTDTGTAVSAFGLDIDSPDIWVRNLEPLQETIDFDLLDYAEGAPHQLPLESSDRYVYARIKNIGSTYASLEAKVRFYLVLDTPGTLFKFPNHFTESGDVSTGGAGVKLLDEVVINEGDISYEGIAVVKVLWPKDESDVNTALETSILVEITPHDGPFFGPDGSGELLAHNNNLSRKKILFREEIEITGIGGSALPNIVDVPSNDISTPIPTSFNIHISDFVEFVTEDVKLIFTLNEFGPITTIEFTHDGSSWGFDATPMGDWVTVDDPLIELYEPADLASGNQRNVLFSGTINSPGTFDTVKIRAEYSNTGGQSFFKEKTIDIDVLSLPGPTVESEDPVEKNTIYFFSEYDLFTIGQTNLEAFGPNPSNLTHEYRTTSSHKASSHPKAFAVTTGQVMIQQTADPDLVNVILKPRHQGAFDFLDVKYFVYRGIQKNQLIDVSDDELVAPIESNPFIASIWETQQAINEAIENADPSDAIEPGSVTDQPSARGFGIQYVGSTSEPWHVEKADTDSIDELFYDTVSDFGFPIVKAGEEFGKFDKDNIGFDIILSGMGDVTTFGEVRGTDNMVVVPTLGGSPSALDYLTDRSKRAKILNFIDPAAFYGIHIFSGINAIDQATGDDKLLFENDDHDAYEFIIKLFYNKNRTYLDIRNENGYNFNYYDNYTQSGTANEIKLSFDSSISPLETVYGTQSWPIRIIENADLETGEVGDKNALFIEIPKGDNQQPLLYTPYASLYKKFPKTPKQKKRFIEVDFSGGNLYSDTIKFGLPNRSDNGATTAISWYIKMAYIRRNLPGNIAGTTMVPNGINTFDNVFPLVDVLPWESVNSVKFVSGFNSRYIEREDFAFVGDMGIALETDRVYLYSVPEDVYFSSGKKVGLFKRILGGTSNKSSFFDVLKNILPDLGVQKRTLTISGVEKNCLTYNDSGFLDETESDKRNFFCINMMKVEFDSLLLEGDTIGLDKDLHYPALVIDSVSLLADDDDNAYYKYNLKIAGIDTTGNYVKAPLVVEAYSVDGIMVTTHDFAFSETPEELEEKCIEFDFNDQEPDYYATYGKVIKRVSPFEAASGVKKNKWQLYTETGTDKNYVGGEIDNFGNTKLSSDPIEIPVGTRCVLLGCKELAVSEFSSIKSIRIVCWLNGTYHEGYISNLAFANSISDRVLPTEGFTGDELYNAFVNDCRLELHLAQAIAIEVTSSISSGFLALLVDLGDLLDFTDPGSIIQKYVNGSVTDKSTILNRIKGEGNNLGLVNSFYPDSSGVTRLDLPKTLQNYVDKITALGLITDANFEYIPLAPDLLPTLISGLTPYDEEFANYLTSDCPMILSEFYGSSGSTSGRDTNIALNLDTDFNTRITELAKIRTWLADKKLIEPTRAILATKEADWFLDSSRSATSGTGSVDYFFDKLSLVYLSSKMIRNIDRSGFRVRDFIAEGIPIDQSFGPLNSDNVFSVFVHEFNVSAGIDIVQFAGDTHFGLSDIPLYTGSFGGKPAGETAWRYVRDNDFTTFVGHGFKPDGTYLQDTKEMGGGNNTKTQNIADFFQRNPSLGVVYMKLYLDKILQGL